MDNTRLVSILGRSAKPNGKNSKVFLIKPPYFTPWTPPLGIAILKTYLQQHGYTAQCVDFNVDPELWGMHHKYFTILRSLEDVSINDGYSKLWWILNAHMLAYVNTNGDAAKCTKVLETVVPLYGISIEPKVIEALLPLVDKFFRRLDYLVDQSNLADFSVVGTSTYTTSLASSLFILKKLKQQYPHIRTVMGGGVFADDLALGSDNLDTLIREYDYVDNIILGEGELLLLKVLNGEFSGKRVVSIRDLGSSTLGMKDVPIPDFSDLNLEDYYHLTIEGARSCPFQCSFCSETIQWGDYRKKPIDQFADQVITLAQQYQNNSFFMGDSLMNPYINPFASKLIERNANVLYDGYLRADKPVTNRKFVKLWADSGCYRVRLGIESAASRVLDSMDKMTTPQVISDVLKTLANGGIRTTTYWIVGFAGETESDFQETLDFVREHHRYIYELEAHPYYYYPYGQVGSRLHQCFSLYPDEITDIIKFKVWEIENSNPTREERYDRLRRFSALAGDLGLPNIYTMAERYLAEDRWHALYPLAAKVYEGTGFRSEKVRLPKEAVPAFAGTPSLDRIAPETNVLCYRVSVSKKLDEGTLSTALERLIESQPLLQMRLQDGKYTTVNGAQTSNESLLVLCEIQPDSPAQVEALRTKIIEKLAAEMRPERRGSIRAALFHDGEDSSELILLLHRGIGDGKSIALLFESLFRIYEQLANEKPISLRPVPKSYADFIRELKTKGEAPVVFSENTLSAPENDGSKTNSETVVIDRTVLRRMSGTALRHFDLKPFEVLSIAVLQSLAKAKVSNDTPIDAMVDYRTVFDKLELTVGPLTRVCRLPQGLLAEEEISSSFLRQALQSLRQAPATSLRGQTSSNEQDTEALLLNFEYFIEEPWLGGDQWRPEGFRVSTNGLKPGYGLEIVPRQTSDALHVQLTSRDNPQASQLAKAVADNLAQQVEAIVDHCERYLSAKEFWLGELGAAISNSETGNGNNHRERGSIVCDVDEESLNKLAAECDADKSAVLFAVYTILLSRLNGREKVLLAASVADDEEVNFVPLRLNPAWKLTFKQFVEEVQRKTSLASKHRISSFEVVVGDIFAADQNALSSALGFGYVFRNSTASGSDGACEFAPLVGRDLTLNVLQSEHGLSLHLIFDKGQFKQASMESMSAHLSSILDQANEDVNKQLQAIVFKRKHTHINPSETLAAEAFHF
ncbi:MAG TPA: condensation domain-containing protein [Pyrinomonadaceae bacterium]|nr:condensation domain-containing protein [Pyrinomonadaceae bacterium]